MSSYSEFSCAYLGNRIKHTIHRITFNQKKDMKAIMYYAVKGMIASEATAIETLTKRISILAEHRPELCGLMIEGIAVAVHVMNNAKLCKLLGVKTVENVKCNVVTNTYLQQKVYIEYDCEGKHHCDTYNLPFDVEQLKEVLDVEYV